MLESLLRRALENPELELRRSRFSDADALWMTIENREISHVDSATSLDIRVGRKNISRHRRTWGKDERFEFRKTTSDWVTFRLDAPADADDALELIELACDHNRA